MYPSVTGFLRDPSIVMTLPCCTVTARLNASGQSSGHGVSTTEAGPPRTGSGREDIARTIAFFMLDPSEPRIASPAPRQARGAASLSTGESRPRVVIVGGGFGGLHAARALAGAPVRVTLLDRHNYHLFQPLLYQVATASLSPGDIASPIRWVLRRQKNIEVLLAEARAIDPSTRQVTLDRGSASYDYLIVAAGSSHAYRSSGSASRFAPTRS